MKHWTHIRSPRNPFLYLAFAGLAWVAVAAVDLTAGEDSPATPTASREIPPEEAALHKRPVRDTPLNREITQALKEQRQQVDELHARFQAAKDETEALSLQRQIARIKQQGEIDLLQIQLRHMRKVANSSKVSQMEEDIRQLQDRVDARFGPDASSTPRVEGE